MRMDQTFFILGRIPSISFTELWQRYSVSSAAVQGISAQCAIIETSAQDAANVLGGVPKAGSVVDVSETLSAEHLAAIIGEHATKTGKLHFGLSMYVMGKKVPNAQEQMRLGLSVKKVLKDAGRSVRYVESRQEALSSVDVVKNKLLGPGIELCVFVLEHGFVIGKTTSVQPFEQYSKRDYGRPGRDPKRGMLPPKLARSMVHFARASEGGLIADPFCGIGTVLQEAMLLGYKTIGTDIDEEAVRAAVENAAWLSEQEGVAAEENVEVLDARNLTKRFAPDSFDAVVSELDLGPPLGGRESSQEVRQTESRLSGLYTESLSMIHTALKPQARAVIAWPYFAGHDIYVSAFNDLSGIGFKLIEPYPEAYQQILPLSDRGTLIYGRAGQQVFREILILEKE